jgi:hypothetical protein
MIVLKFIVMLIKNFFTEDISHFMECYAYLSFRYSFLFHFHFNNCFTLSVGMILMEENGKVDCSNSIKVLGNQERRRP